MKKIPNEKVDEELIKEVESKEHYSTGMIILYFVLYILGLKYSENIE